MADFEATSSNPTTSTSNPARRGGRGGRFRQAPREDGVNSAENQYAEPSMNPRGGHRGFNGNRRGKTDGLNRSQNPQNQPNFAFNPNAPAFETSQFGPAAAKRGQNRNRRGNPGRGGGRQNDDRNDSQNPNPQSQNPRNRNQNGDPRNPQNPRQNRNQNPQENRRNPQQNHRKSQGARRREQKEEPLTEEETKMLADKPLRERLVYLLENNKYECAICYTRITTRQGVWSCKTCYHIFHISTGCITDWAKSSRDKEAGSNTWRCPTCQTENETMPYNYYCFCGRMRNPNFRVGEIPHSCGETCGGARKFGCPHPCTELCHPGPCAECKLYTTKSCNCGKTKKSVRCGSGQEVLCDTVCGKTLSCGQHTCQKICHAGECGECQVVLEQACFCGKHPREVTCNPSSREKYSCGVDCDGMFSCGVHHCTKKCHDKACGECETGISKIRTCPCGKKSLQSLGITRTKCTDKVPTCDSICDKWLNCGTPGKNHRCREKCHEGPCPPCNLNTSVVCRCGTSKGVIPCDEYLEIMKTTGEYLCNKRCRKKKSCGMHKCQEVCCIQDEHYCLQMCNKRLSCGTHTCENVCHAGQCRPCLQASFDEQFCHCGTTVRMPPIPCGARLPVCSQPCARPHRCDHPVTHKCHGDQGCPPCTQLTDKTCYGGHTVRKNIPCHIESVSCGVICSKPLKCGVHVCQRTCHGDECEKEGEKCTKKCETIRELCEHPCALPCHEDAPCEPSPCKTMVRVTCECGRIKKQVACCEVDKLIQSKLEKEDTADSVEPGKLKRSASFSQLNCMKCDDECKKLERNRKVAEALEVDTDEYGMNKLAPTISFPCYLKDMVRTNLEFVKQVEKVLIDLVIQILSGEAYHDVFRYHLPPMSIERRRFVHEYANFFNIASESVDSPPKRSIVLTATRGKSHQPLVLISDLVNYKGALKTPGPAIIRKDLMEQAMSKKEETEGLMKPLRCTEKMVVRREARPMKELPTPVPLKQQNQFALLGSDMESDDEEEKPKETTSTSPPKDWWKDEEEPGWQKVQQKEFVVEVERDMTEEEVAAAEAKKLEELEGPTWEDDADDDEEEAEQKPAVASEEAKTSE
ncbi:CBN-TAG-182 protein [Caenorhabditis brenneri]|uniref:CBN-TAG-182 protein n=1 Tax=Caenorhabditis brenneri TaxID=135651 RepID=G0MLR0_CAEBE|nr:CBN-TAG-182 protein [Caenorhabditis brenneri]